MVEESLFRGVISLLDKIGVYDIILPFLLVFTIVFAILEKTKALGTEKIGGNELTKKNLNSMVAFVVAFLVIASTQLVAVISQVMANVVLLLILAICFLMLVGVFFGTGEIFLNALDWLKYIFYLFQYWDAEWAATIFFFLVILGFIYYIIRDTPGSSAPVKK